MGGRGSKMAGKAGAAPAAPSDSRNIWAKNGSMEAVLKQASAYLGQSITASDLADLAGAPSGAEVVLSLSGTTVELRFRTEGQTVAGLRTLSDETGNVVLGNESLTVKEEAQGKGLGTKVFAQQVKAAAKLGINEIHTYADKGDGVNGYYTWARLGYKMEVYGEAQSRAKAQGFGTITNTHQLFAKPGGAAFWKKYGEDGAGVFDTREGSQSRKALSAYMQSKGYKE